MEGVLGKGAILAQNTDERLYKSPLEGSIERPSGGHSWGTTIPMVGAIQLAVSWRLLIIR